MICHIFDIDVLLTVDLKPWIIDKNNPNVPLLKLDKSDFNLIKSGLYKSQKNKIEFNDKIFWLPKDLYNQLKVISKNKKINIENMAISMQEFINTDVISELNYSINFDNISHLKNKNEDIYITCSSNSERNYKELIVKMQEKLADEGILVKKFYYINDTFSNSNIDDIFLKKNLICLKHLVGYDIQNVQFIDSEVKKYSKVYFYDDDFDTLKMVNDINTFLKLFISKTEIGLRNVIIEDVPHNKAIFIVNKISNNKYQKVSTKEIKISLLDIVKKFENFGG